MSSAIPGIVIMKDIDHAALRTTGGMVQVVIIKPGSIIQCDGNCLKHVTVRQGALVPVNNLAEWNHPETKFLDRLKVRCQCQVIVLSICPTIDVHAVIRENRDFQLIAQGS